jgi:hypothetical protein
LFDDIAIAIAIAIAVKGYTVRGTVRSLGDASKFHHLLKMPHAERLRVYAADLIESGSFDEAFEGIIVVVVLPV